LLDAFQGIFTLRAAEIARTQLEIGLQVQGGNIDRTRRR
jgi:hypothetical protein